MLEGPNAAGPLATLSAPIPGDVWSHSAWNSGTVQRTPHGFALCFPRGQSPNLNVPRATAEEARVVRIEQSRPRYGEELSERNLVQEAGLMHTVSFSKGCYLGQEIIERVRSRGQVHKQLRGLELDGNQPPEPGAKVLAGGTEAGEIASAVFSPALGKCVAMAYMRTPSAEPGTEVSVGSLNGRVRAAALP
jgi:folate-binding protein YgfZ